MPELGRAAANDLSPNTETLNNVLTLNDGAPAGTIGLTGIPTVALLYADKPFCVGRTLANADPTKAPVIPASTLYYHPVNGATKLVIRQATGGDTVNLRSQIFGKASNESA